MKKQEELLLRKLSKKVVTFLRKENTHSAEAKNRKPLHNDGTLRENISYSKETRDEKSQVSIPIRLFDRLTRHEIVKKEEISVESPGNFQEEKRQALPE